MKFETSDGASARKAAIEECVVEIECSESLSHAMARCRALLATDGK